MAKRDTQDRIQETLSANPGMNLDDLFKTLLPGATRRTGDIVGTWDSEDSSNPIVCIPRHAMVGDGKKFDKSKPSLLIFVELVKPCRVFIKGEEQGATIVAAPGDMVGIWAKPGMRDIAMYCDTSCVMARDPSLDKNTDKGNPMKGYRFASPEKGSKRIPITIDRREKSKGNMTFLDVPGAVASGSGIQEGDIPIT